MNRISPNPAPTLFVVEDDPEVREAIELFLSARDFAVESFADGPSYLEAFDPQRPGCLLLDVRMPGMGGLDLQQRLAGEPMHPPIIILTGHGDIPMAVRALNQGAVDFIQKPFNDKRLLASIHKALELDGRRREEQRELAAIAGRLQRLTRREREILDLIIAGERTKVIAIDLGISLSTVESHRAHILDKMAARNLSELMRMMIRLEAGNGGRVFGQD